MRLLKVGLIQLLLISALGLASAVPALAELTLPDVSVLSGDTYPATGEGTVEGAEVVKLETELGEKLTGSRATFKVEFTKLSSLGPATLTLVGIVEPRSKTFCHSLGEPEGTLKIEGEYHVVDTSLSPLTVTHLFLFPEFLALCNGGKLLVKVRGPVLIKLEKVSSGVDITAYGLVIQCVGKGKQELKEYFNDAAEKTKGAASANFGLGFEAACFNISKELVVKSSKMVDFVF
jgi:hypothetical protein